MDTKNDEFINITQENLEKEHLCCIIRSKKVHPGIDAKKKWLSERINEGHIFRKLNVKGCAFIEYSPLQTAWVPINGDNYFYIYCLWVTGEYKNSGYGKQLLEYCINDAKSKGKSGICMLGCDKQKAWLSNQAFAKKYGFKTVDKTNSGYELLALSFDGSVPFFSENTKTEQIECLDLTIYYDMQCPYILQRIDLIKKYCVENNITVFFNEIDTIQKAKSLPCVFNNWAVFYKGKFQSVNLLDISTLERILKK